MKGEASRNGYVDKVNRSRPDPILLRVGNHVRLLTDAELPEATRASMAEMRRHMDTVAEEIHSELDRILELLHTLSRKLDRFQEDLREGFRKIHQRLDRLETRLDSRKRGCPRPSPHPLRRRKGGRPCDE